MKWVKIRKYYDISGDTLDAVQKKLARGIWVEGVHIKTAPDGARWVNVEAVEAWVERGLAGVQANVTSKKGSRSVNSVPGHASKSASTSEESDVVSV